MAKQHQARGEDGSALKMYELARPYFPDNEKLKGKIERLKERLAVKKGEESATHTATEERPASSRSHGKQKIDPPAGDDDESYHDEGSDSAYLESDDDGKTYRSRPKKSAKQVKRKARASSPDPLASQSAEVTGIPTPRTQHLLDVINTRDVGQIKTLNGLGVKRAEGIVDYLNEQAEGDEEAFLMRSWTDLAGLRGIGKKTLETMREGVLV
jgi:DNA uptake protein ComE-like DNA-binding protein